VKPSNADQNFHATLHLCSQKAGCNCLNDLLKPDPSRHRDFWLSLITGEVLGIEIVGMGLTMGSIYMLNKVMISFKAVSDTRNKLQPISELVGKRKRTSGFAMSAILHFATLTLSVTDIFLKFSMSAHILKIGREHYGCKEAKHFALRDTKGNEKRVLQEDHRDRQH
jgi:hypothetical protein